MPLHEEPTQVGSKLIYVRPTCGHLETEDGEFQSVEGKFIRLWTAEDPGNKQHKIAPGTKLYVDVEDETALYRIQVRLETTFGWCLAGYLANTDAGSWVKIEAKSGDDPKITLLNFWVKNGEEWGFGNTSTVTKLKTETYRTDAAKELVSNHPALYIRSLKEAE